MEGGEMYKGKGCDSRDSFERYRYFLQKSIVGLLTRALGAPRKVLDSVGAFASSSSSSISSSSFSFSYRRSYCPAITAPAKQMQKKIKVKKENQSDAALSSVSSAAFKNIAANMRTYDHSERNAQMIVA